MFLPKKILEEKLRRILAEDLGQGDLTSTLIVPEGCIAEAEMVAKETGVVAGIEEASLLVESLGLNFEAYVKDGDAIKPKQVLMRISGDARTILSAERTILNVVSRMSGIATTTRKLVEKIRKAKYKTRVACTRKTAPGLLYFDKKAVFTGGGDPHRLHLDDMILIKDNHIAIAGSVKKAVKKAKEKASFSKKIEVEVAKIGDVLEAAKAGADVIMLDNFSPKQVEETVKILKKAGYYGKVLLEASGGITADNILDFASKGIDIVSLGEITHSVKALNISLEIVKVYA
ncbi:MAG: carboxylating nicotinate-nucleotide diphosphorylase [Candidatus Bathyarchaeia archaeon]